MKRTKRIFAAAAAAAMLASLGACAEKPKESGITGAEAQEEFWNLELDKSAEKLNAFRPQSPEEVTSIWRQARVQGNGALMYALYSADLKPIFLEKAKREYGGWNLYITAQAPEDVTCSAPEKVEGSDMYVSDVTALKADGNLYYSQIFIELVDGGYYVVSESAEYMTNENGDLYIEIESDTEPVIYTQLE